MDETHGRTRPVAGEATTDAPWKSAPDRRGEWIARRRNALFHYFEYVTVQVAGSTKNQDLRFRTYEKPFSGFPGGWAFVGQAYSRFGWRNDNTEWLYIDPARIASAQDRAAVAVAALAPFAAISEAYWSMPSDRVVTVHLKDCDVAREALAVLRSGKETQGG